MLRRNGFLPVALLAPLALMAALPVQAADLNVPTTLYPTIAAAISAANPSGGDRILVAAGTYNEAVNFGGKPVVLAGVGTNFSSIIVPPAGQRAVTFNTNEGNGSQIGGFTIMAGTGVTGSGILIQNASPVVAANVIRNMSGTTGPGILGDGTNAIIIDNKIFDSDCGGTTTAEAALKLINTSSAQIVNNLIVGANCNGMYINTTAGTTPLILNNTIADTNIGMELATYPSATAVFRNNLIALNAVGVKVDSGTDPGTPNASWQSNLLSNTVNYQNWVSQTAQNSNISGAPLFVNPASGDYTLQATSPAINTGSTANLPGQTVALPAYDDRDLANGLRVVGTAVDIGAYEFDPPANFSSSAMPLWTVLVLAGVSLSRRRRTT